ncbi:MAG: hypothetical protein J5798_08605 [Spirochaetaceae bacterium]|nr:hypothetical protein [Spirochaetaceae bacterium]
MEKEPRIFLNYLEALPEVRNANCVKVVQQLRTYLVQIKKEWPYAKDKLYSRVSKRVQILQDVISDQQCVQELRKIQSECDKLFSRQKYEQQYDIDVACRDPDSWCGVDCEY